MLLTSGSQCDPIDNNRHCSDLVLKLLVENVLDVRQIHMQLTIEKTWIRI